MDHTEARTRTTSMDRIGASATCLLVSLTLAGCFLFPQDDMNPPAEARGPTTVAQACQQFAEGYCRRYTACYPLIESTLGGTEACEGWISDACAVLYGQPDSLTLGTDILGCVPLLDRLSCGDFVSGSAILHAFLSCARPGRRADGASCAEAPQCASLGCAKEVGAQCGRCARMELAAEGGACSSDTECRSGLVCRQNRCVAPSGQGGPCDGPGQLCQVGLNCRAGKCVPSRKLGESCDPNQIFDCDFLSGLSCDSATSTCKAPRKAQIGESCAGIGVLCVGGSDCVKDRCVARPREGEPCGMGGLFSCQLPAQCAGGTCRRIDVSNIPNRCP